MLGSNSVKRLEPLDTLRGIAAIGVAIFWHYQHFKPEVYPFEKYAYWFYHYGWLGVDFFFVLSGFVFSYVYGEKIVSRSIDIKTFLVLRLSRLYPVFIVTTFVVAIIQWGRKFLGLEFFVYPYNDFYHLLLNIPFLHFGWFENGFSFNAPSWSIAEEFIAYIIFFSILYFYPKKKYVLFYSMILVGLFLQKTQAHLPLFNQEVARVLLAFFIGCFTYKINYGLQGGDKRCLYIILSVTLLTAIVAMIFGQEFLGARYADVYVVLFFPCLIMGVLNIGFLKKIASFRPFVYLGDISYSIYLWHFPVQLLLFTGGEMGVFTFNAATRLWLLVYVVLVIAAGSISYRYETRIRYRIREAMLGNH